MKNCKHFRQQLIVATYHELSAEDLALLQQHLAQCQACQTEAAELGAIMNLLQLKVQLEPTDRQLEANRSELHRRLLLKKQRSSSARFWTRVWQLVSLDFAPSIRFAAALGLLVIGIFLGRTFLPSNTAYSSQLMELAESNLAQVQAIEYNQQTRQVSIQFNAINHVTIEGDLDRSEIQRLLAQVLVYEQRPNIRLKTVRALELIRHFDRETVIALSRLVDREENPGIRLRAMKLLAAMPLTSDVKDMLITLFSRALIKENNSAIRIEAFEGLARLNDPSVRPLILNVAKKDTNEYIQTRAKQVLARAENSAVPNHALD
ncbi:MAG: hypothetical protein ONB27_08410 [candidate division KSB1 bacterium]|nr:hypothetical protein [candidate division KSB1 bacterium]